MNIPACLAVAARWRRRAITTAAVIIGGGSSVLACPLCFGAEETSMVDGTKLGVLVLLAITLVVQGGFVGFFLYLRKRAKHSQLARQSAARRINASTFEWILH